MRTNLMLFFFTQVSRLRPMHTQLPKTRSQGGGKSLLGQEDVSIRTNTISSAQMSSEAATDQRVQVALTLPMESTMPRDFQY